MSVTKLIGREEASSTKRTQVWQATHERGGNRLPFMHRSFISFKYNNIWCEDMGLIATIDGDRYEKNLYTEFNDITSDSDIIDGQFYWGTHFNGHTLSFTLSTDGIDEAQLGEIKRWLKPGKICPLVLSENPNREILARINETPTFSFLPFEGSVKMPMIGRVYDVKTTLYKGEIKVSFASQEPFWTAKTHLLDYISEDSDSNGGYWTDANDKITSVYSDGDALKIIYEDRIPVVNMIAAENMMFGTEYGVLNKISNDVPGDEPLVGFARVGIAKLGQEINSTAFKNGIEIAAGESNSEYLYYPGTAPSYPYIEFSLRPQFASGNDVPPYIINPKNPLPIQGSGSYNTLTLECLTEHNLCFTAPTVYLAYNKAIEILSSADRYNNDTVRLYDDLKDQINHWAVREQVFKLLNCYKGQENNTSWITDTITNLKKIFLQTSQDGSDVYYQLRVKIDCQKGETYITTWINNIQKNNNSEPIFTVINNGQNTNAITLQDEPAGNIIKSNYLVLNERNEVDERGYIRPLGYVDNLLFKNACTYSFEPTTTSILPASITNLVTDKENQDIIVEAVKDINNILVSGRKEKYELITTIGKKPQYSNEDNLTEEQTVINNKLTIIKNILLTYEATEEESEDLIDSLFTRPIKHVYYIMNGAILSLEKNGLIPGNTYKVTLPSDDVDCPYCLRIRYKLPSEKNWTRLNSTPIQSNTPTKIVLDPDPNYRYQMYIFIDTNTLEWQGDESETPKVYTCKLPTFRQLASPINYKPYSYKIYHDVANGIENFKILYDYKYY